MTKIDYQTLVRWINKYPTVPIIWLLFTISKIKSLYGKAAPTQSEKPVNKILIIKLAGLGDAVLMLRPVRALRRTFPKAHIEVFAAPSSAGVFYDEPAVDSVRVFDLFGTQKGLRHFVKEILDLKKQNFDMVCDFEQHTLMVAVLSWFTGASTRIGLAAAENIRKLLLTDAVLIDGHRHMADFYCDLADRSGALDAAQENGALFVDDNASKKTRQWLEKAGITKEDSIIGIHPGSGKRCTARRWLPDRFAMLIDTLQDNVDAKIILTGTKEETELLDSIADLCKATPIVSRQEFSVKELACLIGLCDVFISNDTGPMHIGPAMGTPTIGLFGPNSPLRYKPLGSIHRTIYKRMPCSPCIHIHLGQAPDCKMARPSCMDAIEVDDVLCEVQDLLRRTSTKRLIRPVKKNRV